MKWVLKYGVKNDVKKDVKRRGIARIHTTFFTSLFTWSFRMFFTSLVLLPHELERLRPLLHEGAGHLSLSVDMELEDPALRVTEADF